MDWMRTLIIAGGIVGSVAAACNAQETGTDTGFSVAGSVLSIAPTMTYGETVAGSITGKQIDVWGIDLVAGDHVTIHEAVSDGDLAPDLLLFRGAAAGSISSASYDAPGGSLTKTYEVERNGRYFIAVRAYQSQGAGDYTLTVTCNGGPCAGETPPPVETELTNGQTAVCLMRARFCAFEKMGVYEGAVGPARARKLVNDCMAETTIDNDEGDIPLSCKAACDRDDETKEGCDALIDLLPWAADGSEACLEEWDSCMSDCYDYASWGYWDTDELYESTEAICALGMGPFGGGCRYHVPDVDVCGGTLEIESTDYCKDRCQSIDGAFVDDTSDLCDHCY